MASRNASTPGIGAYWLCPARIASAARSTSAGSQSKSGKPCDRLMAPWSVARRVMTVKMLVPVPGSFEVSGIVGAMPPPLYRPPTFESS